MLVFGRLVIGGLILFASCAAAHADWRYCLATSEANHKVFMSNPFLADAPIETTEAGFDEMLQRTGIAHEHVQCPHAPGRGQIKVARKDAISFNKEFLARTTVELSWAPTSSRPEERVRPPRQLSVRVRPTPSAVGIDQDDATAPELAQIEAPELFIPVGR